MIKIAKTRGTKNSYSVLFIKLSLHDKPPPPPPMNYLHTPPHQNCSSVCELSLYIPQNGCFPFRSFFNLIIIYSYYFAALHSLKDSIWYNLQIGLVIEEFDFRTLTMTPQTLSSCPLMSSTTIPIFHVETNCRVIFVC